MSVRRVGVAKIWWAMAALAVESVVLGGSVGADVWSWVGVAIGQ